MNFSPLVYEIQSPQNVVTHGLIARQFAKVVKWYSGHPKHASLKSKFSRKEYFMFIEINECDITNKI